MDQRDIGHHYISLWGITGVPLVFFCLNPNGQAEAKFVMGLERGMLPAFLLPLNYYR
jgi:hypothetical protein